VSDPLPSRRAREPGKIRSLLLALAVHGAFFALIVFGVSWQSRPTPPLQAELYKELPPGKPAAPKPDPAPEPPKPEPPKPEPPKPEPPKPEPAKPVPPKVEPKPEPPKPDPAIAEKKERERKEKERKEKAERDKQEKLEKQRREEAEKKRAADEAEKKRKAEEDKARQAKARAEAQAKAAAEQAAREAASARESEINAWRGRIRDKIRGRANVPDTVTGRPVVAVRITLLPGGEVLDIRVEKSSGNRIFDEAIVRAIRSASPLPVPPASSELFPQFRDLRLNIDHDR